jgi:hypothetical protein
MSIQSMVRTKPERDERWLRRRTRKSRSCAQESFGMAAEKGNLFKMKRQIRPRRITIELLTNVKGMGVILHGLRPVLINR